MAGTTARLAAIACDTGYVPDSLDTDGNPRGPRRVDVVAQTLRAMILLRAHGALTDATPAIDHLAATLRDAVRADGSVPFAIDQEGPQANAWAAMFAQQALAWHRGIAPEEVAAPWIV